MCTNSLAVHPTGGSQMLNNTYHQNCNPHNCVFVQDLRDSHKYFCLKYGTGRQLNNFTLKAGILALILLLSLILLPMVNRDEEIKQPKPQQEQPLIAFLNNGLILLNAERSFNGSSFQFIPKICNAPLIDSFE
jgi:hypothetical protein